MNSAKEKKLGLCLLTQKLSRFETFLPPVKRPQTPVGARPQRFSRQTNKKNIQQLMVDSGPGYTMHTVHTAHTAHTIHTIHTVHRGVRTQRDRGTYRYRISGRNLRSICARRAEEGCQRVICPPLICTDKGPGPAV